MIYVENAPVIFSLKYIHSYLYTRCVNISQNILYNILIYLFIYKLISNDFVQLCFDLLWKISRMKKEHMICIVDFLILILTAWELKKPLF
jgi:hypothetical protein